jgi:iron complex outermembrane recepter protein
MRGTGKGCGYAVAAAVALALATASQAAQAAQATPAADEQELEEVTVTGSRIKRDGFDAPNPLTVIGIEQMEKLGQTNVAEVLSSIPQNISNQSETNAGVAATANVGSNFANLRGLNPVAGTRTLTLVDSRRFVPTSDGGAVDLNVIPSALISRIESITGGASAAYGSDAVGGVVNVILDHKFTGFKSQIDFGQTFQGDGDSKHLSFGYGAPVGTRGHVLLGAEYQDNSGIGDCAEKRTWCAEGWDYYTNNGIVDAAASPQRTTVGGAVNQTNRRYLGQPNFIVGPGSRQAYNVSSGVFRNLAPTPAALINKKFNDAGTGILDMDPGKYVSNLAILPRMGGDGDSTFADSALRVPLERYSLFSRGSWQLTDRLELFSELAYAARKVKVAQQIAGPRSTFFIRPDNAYLPASVAALFPVNGQASLGKDMDETLVGTNRSKADVMRWLVGANGKLAGSWTWDAYYQYGSNERHQTFDKTRVNDKFAFALDAVDQGRFLTGTANGNIMCRALLQNNAAATGCQPLNLFGIGGITQAAVDYAYSTAPEDFEYAQQVISAAASGDLWKGFGAGAITAAVGGELRREYGDVTHGNIPNYNQFAFTFGQDFSGTIDVLEGFAEVNLPVLKDVAIARSLELNGAFRITQNKSHDRDPKNLLPAGTDKSKTVDFNSWKLSAIWDATDWLRVRATRSRDMRAAGFRELFFKAVPTESGTAQGRVNNPFNQAAPNTIDATPILNAGNFALTPEKADTWTAGIVLSPGGALQGLRFSADWYEIQIKDAVSTTSAQQIVDFCRDGADEFCDRITFNASPTGGVGPRGDITFVSAGQVNLGRFATRGLDLELGYAFPLSKLGDWANGTLSMRTLATLNYDLLFQATPLAPLLDYSGQTGASAFADFANGPKWQLNSLFSYSLDRFSTTLTVRYIPSGSLNSQWIGPDDERYAGLIAASMSDLTSALPVNTVNDNTVKSRTYFGISANYKVPLSDGKSWEVFGVINNLFDKDPPIAPGGNNGPGTNYPTNPVYFDTLGASVRAGIRLNF